MTPQNLAAWAALAAIFVLFGWFLRRDTTEYAVFKALTDTRDRQRMLLRWTFRSFLLFGAGGLLGLVATGRTDALTGVPPEFEALAAPLASWGASFDYLLGFALAVLALMIVARLLLRRGAKKPAEDESVIIGDVEALLPRNAGERWCAALMSLNAGFSEEIFFRAFLPLLLVEVTGAPLLALGAAAFLFGALHLYQGWAGVLATTLAAAGFSFVYLATGSIWWAVVLHAAMDMNALLLQPALRAWLKRAKK